MPAACAVVLVLVCCFPAFKGACTWCCIGVMLTASCVSEQEDRSCLASRVRSGARVFSSWARRRVSNWAKCLLSCLFGCERCWVSTTGTNDNNKPLTSRQLAKEWMALGNSPEGATDMGMNSKREKNNRMSRSLLASLAPSDSPTLSLGRPQAQAQREETKESDCWFGKGRKKERRSFAVNFARPSALEPPIQWEKRWRNTACSGLRRPGPRAELGVTPAK